MIPQIDQIMNTPDDTLLTPADVARLLGCTPGAVRRNIKIAKYSAVQIAGKWYMTGKGVKASIVFSNPI
jgi:hypothetical protein